VLQLIDLLGVMDVSAERTG